MVELSDHFMVGLSDHDNRQVDLHSPPVVIVKEKCTGLYFIVVLS